MSPTRTHVFTAEDGEQFKTFDECKAHEEDVKLGNLTDLTIDNVMGAVRREPNYLKLADAIEFAGNLIAEKRRADGDVKRKKKPPKD